MPTYEYICSNENCCHDFETFQSMKDDPLKSCPECGQDSLKRKIGLGAGIIFKGSGFYETDYKKPAKTESKSTDSNSSTSTEKKDTKKAEVKSDH